MYTEELTPFRCFSRCFCKNSYTGLPIYKEAIYQIIEVGPRLSLFTESQFFIQLYLLHAIYWLFIGLDYL